MTLLDTRNQLLQHFCGSDTFSSTDFAAINLDPAYAEKSDALIRATLAELEEDGLIKSAGTDFWILRRPLDSAGQDVHLSMEMCVEIAGVINAYLDAHETEGARCDASNIGEEDVGMVLDILDDILTMEPRSDGGEN